MNEKLMLVLRQALRECGSEGNLSPDTDLVEELGVDSLGLLSIASALEKAFQVRIADHELEQLRHIRNIIRLVSGNSPAPCASDPC